MTATATTTFGNYIAGEWRPAASGEVFENRNPANRDDLVGLFAKSGAEDVDAALAAAHGAAASWRRTSPIQRAAILFKAAEILASRANDVGRDLTREEGKTLNEGIGETNRAVQILRYYAGEAQQPDGEHYPSAEQSDVALYRAGAARRLRDRHPLELPDCDSDLEDRPGARLWQHGRHQTGQRHAALRGAIG